MFIFLLIKGQLYKRIVILNNKIATLTPFILHCSFSNNKASHAEIQKDGILCMLWAIAITFDSTQNFKQNDYISLKQTHINRNKSGGNKRNACTAYQSSKSFLKDYPLRAAITVIWHCLSYLTMLSFIYRRVHISATTYSYLNGEFEVEPGYGEKRDESLRIAGLKTYFIVRVLKPVSIFL